MLETLMNPVLPIYAALAVGFFLRKQGIMNDEHARAANAFAFYMAIPALIVSVVGKTPISEFEWSAVLSYFFAQMVIYASVASLMYYVFKREIREALLLGMAANFVNHVFFVLPIAERVIGADAGLPMAGIVLLDSGFTFPLSVLVTAALSSGEKDKGKLVGLLLKNPFIYASPFGVLLGLLGDKAPGGIMTFAEFAGAAAAPVLLFTLGITLAGTQITRIGGAVWTVVGVKLFMHPAIVWAGLSIGAASTFTEDIVLLVAAGPCGAMPYLIATQYGVRTESIAKAILVSTTLSIISLSVLTS